MCPGAEHPASLGNLAEGRDGERERTRRGHRIAADQRDAEFGLILGESLNESLDPAGIEAFRQDSAQ
jgi:hypothetical protein